MKIEQKVQPCGEEEESTSSIQPGKRCFCPDSLPAQSERLLTESAEQNESRSDVAKNCAMEPVAAGKCKRRHKKSSMNTPPPTVGCGKWTADEHSKLLAALDRFGNSWAKVEAYVGTRSRAQIRSHVQKYVLKLRKDALCQQPDQSLPRKIFAVTREYRNCVVRNRHRQRKVSSVGTTELHDPSKAITVTETPDPVAHEEPEQDLGSNPGEEQAEAPFSLESFPPSTEPVEIVTLSFEKSIADYDGTPSLAFGWGCDDNLLGQ